MIATAHVTALAGSSLAAGTVLDIDPAETVDVAARAGLRAAGIWFDPDTWTAATTMAVAARLDATGLTPLDMEPVILGRDHDPGDALVDTAGELGVRHVLVASGPASRAAVVDRFGDPVRPRRTGRGHRGPRVPAHLHHRHAARRGRRGAGGEPAQRRGPRGHPPPRPVRGSPADLATVPKSLLPYLQIADAPASPTTRRQPSLRDEALHGRLLPGDGRCPWRHAGRGPVRAALGGAALPTAHGRYPDPTERAQAVLLATRQLLDGAV